MISFDRSAGSANLPIRIFSFDETIVPLAAIAVKEWYVAKSQDR